MENIEKHIWIRFMAPVLPQTAHAMFTCIDNAVKDKCSHLHLLISSNGGSVFHGIALYNYLKGINAEVITHNFGSVDSIATVVFCAGKQRLCVPHSSFLIHPITTQFSNQEVLREKDVEERVKSIQIDTEKIAKIIADTTGKTLKKVEKDMANSTVLNPEEAKNYGKNGLVTEVNSELYNGGEFYAIYENGQIFHYVPNPAITANGTPIPHPLYNMPKPSNNK